MESYAYRLAQRIPTYLHKLSSPAFLHCLNPNPPVWVGYRNPNGSSELERFWANAFEFCGKNLGLFITRSARWVLSPLWTSSSVCMSGGRDGTYISLLWLTTAEGWAWDWTPDTNSGREETPARVAQSKLPEPRLWKLAFSSGCETLREFIRGREKYLSSISGSDSKTSSRWDDDDEDEPLLWDLLGTVLGMGFEELEFFLYIRHKTQSSNCIKQNKTQILSNVNLLFSYLMNNWSFGLSWSQMISTLELPLFLEFSRSLYSCMIQLVLVPFGAFPM